MTKEQKLHLEIEERLLHGVTDERTVYLLHKAHPAAAAERLAAHCSAETASELMSRLDSHYAAEILTQMDPEYRSGVLNQMDRVKLAKVFADMSHDDRVDILQFLQPDKAEHIIRALPAAEQTDIRKLEKYPEGTAGAIMTTDFLELKGNMTATVALEKAKTVAADRETIYIGYVTDEAGKLTGTVSLKDLFLADPKARLSEIMRTDVISVEVTEKREDVARTLSRYDLLAIPVTENSGRLAGIVTFDDAIDVIEQEETADAYSRAGITGFSKDHDHERDISFSKRMIEGSYMYPIKLRMAFLMVTLAGGFLVGGVIDFFEDVLGAVLVAAIFIPVIMDMGGNVGTQSTTIFARGLALGHINVSRMYHHIRREVTIGLMMGLLLGIIGGFAAYLWQGAPNDIPQIGLAVGISLAVVVPFATFLGFFLPWLLLKMGWDHAPGADPFITTIKDFTGLALYFFLVGTLIGV
ncbi:MAG: magnesium transporter [Balneolaceae bacterium]|nr:MAG: magnesium transporter [Balneolaceae bacterium]